MRGGAQMVEDYGMTHLKRLPLDPKSVTPHSQPDGRRRRADASRSRIVEAMLQLAREGMMDPNADLVAERAGVGRRTVFRLFSDMESLYAEMHATMLSRIERIMAIPIEGGTWRARLDALLERRFRLFEEILPIKTAADVHRHHSSFLQTSHATMTRMLREILHFVLPRDVVENPTLFEAVDGVLSIELWRRLRVEQGLSVEAARDVVRRMLAGLVEA